MLRKILVILLSGVALSRAAPATTFDQRQDGDLNVKVDLDNFVILVARPSSSMDLLGPLAELFADVKRGSSAGQQLQSAAEPEAKGQDGPNAKQRDSGKDASPSEQSKEEKLPVNEEMLLLVQEGDKAGRSLEEVVRTLRNLKGREPLLERDVLGKDKSKVIKYKFIETADDTLSLKLIGDAVENCGPGRSRDRLGICQAQN